MLKIAAYWDIVGYLGERMILRDGVQHRWGLFLFFIFYFLLFLYSSTGVERNGDPTHNPTDDLEPREKESREERKQEGKGDP